MFCEFPLLFSFPVIKEFIVLLLISLALPITPLFWIVCKTLSLPCVNVFVIEFIWWESPNIVFCDPSWIVWFLPDTILFVSLVISWIFPNTALFNPPLSIFVLPAIKLFFVCCETAWYPPNTPTDSLEVNVLSLPLTIDLIDNVIVFVSPNIAL